MRQMIIVLTAVMILSGLVLATVSDALEPRIQANQEAALRESLSAIFEGTEEPTFTPVELTERSAWMAEVDGRAIGYAVRVEATGYGGPIQLLVGLSPDLNRIRGISVVESVETPGLGARIQEDDFQEQFNGLTTGAGISAVKNQPADSDENEIEAISGATISTNAVVNAINTAIPEVVPQLQEAD